MDKNINQAKYCNCHISSNTIIFKPNIYNSFCEKCGTIILKNSKGNIYYLLKSRKKIVECELNPINFIKAMKKKTEEEYPNIYNLYNNPEEFENNKKEKSMRSINIYLRYRKFLIQKLQKMIKTYDYHDIIFYQTLFFLDTFLSHDITIEMSEKSILYYLVGYFLCSVKIKETDAYAPSLECFLDLEKGIYLSPSKIALYEVICLKRMKYNIFSYSAYDWMIQLIGNGIVFNVEVDSSNEIILIKGHRHSLINTINKFALKLLLSLISKDIFFKYSPMYLAFSLIQISREKYIKESLIKPKLFFKLIDLYDVNFDDYKDCYEEINSIIKEEIKQDLREKKSEEENNKKTIKLNNLKGSSVDKIEKTFKNKSIYVANKNRSNNAVIAINEDELMNRTKEEIIKYNEVRNKNKKHKTVRNKHFSIDFNSSRYKAGDTLPFIFINSHPEKKEFNTINTGINQFNFKTENEEPKEGKNKSNEKLEEIHINNIRVVKNELLTSMKLPKINFQEIVNNENDKLEQKKEFGGNNENTRKRYKLKSNKLLKIKVAFP